jgi:hypothetical protein
MNTFCEQDISELEAYLASIALPTESLRLIAGETITNLPQFIDSHQISLNPNYGNPTFIATLKRPKYNENLLTSITEAKK